MKFIRLLTLMALVTTVVAACIGWWMVKELRAQNEALKAEFQLLKEQSAAATEAQLARHSQELERLRAEAQEVQKLRNEVNQLRTGTKEAEKLRAENQQLRAAVTNSTASVPAGNVSTPPQTTDHFARENWAFSGYATPEAALVSAVWAMREGTPKTYLDSLSPEEQLRMAKSWENKSEAEIAAKHQHDVANITGVRILERQNVSPDEVLMSIYVEGARRMETVSMKLVNNEWKFGGFKRNK